MKYDRSGCEIIRTKYMSVEIPKRTRRRFLVKKYISEVFESRLITIIMNFLLKYRHFHKRDFFFRIYKCYKKKLKKNAFVGKHV